jgi:hypothetical protein
MTRLSKVRISKTQILETTALAACAFEPQYEPKVDMTGHTAAGYAYDLDSCRADARQMDILKGAGIGLVAGAAAGAGIGAIVGNAGAGAGTGAAVGLFSGAASGSAYEPGRTALTGQDPDAAFVRSCLDSRGYKLIDDTPIASSAGAK